MRCVCSDGVGVLDLRQEIASGNKGAEELRPLSRIFSCSPRFTGRRLLQHSAMRVAASLPSAADKRQAEVAEGLPTFLVRRDEHVAQPIRRGCEPLWHCTQGLEQKEERGE